MRLLEVPVSAIEEKIFALRAIEAGQHESNYLLGAVHALEWIKDRTVDPAELVRTHTAFSCKNP